MWITIFPYLLLTKLCVGIHLIDLPQADNIQRRTGILNWPVERRSHSVDEEKDNNIKTKISVLVQQTIHDTDRKIQSIQELKEKNRGADPYKVGFILSMIKKNRDVLNELFNVAVKHRDDWKTLEQLKIFELIMHTNVDTTNLVRRLVEIHIRHMNATSSLNHRRGFIL